MWEKIVKGACAAAGAVSGLLGGWSMMLTLLAASMVLDYASGLLVAWSGRSPKSETGGVSSRAGFHGLMKKAFIMLIVLLATLLDHAVGNQTMVFQMATAAYYFANEGVSILENAALLGVPFPAKIRDSLEELKDAPTEKRDE